MSENKIPAEYEWIKPGIQVGCFEWCEDLEPSKNPTITLTLTREQADQLLICIGAGLAWDKNFKEMLKMKFSKSLFSNKDRWFIRDFRVRVVNRIKQQIEEKLK